MLVRKQAEKFRSCYVTYWGKSHMPEAWNNLTKASQTTIREGKSPSSLSGAPPPRVGRTSADGPEHSSNTSAAGKITKQVNCMWTRQRQAGKAGLSRGAIPLVSSVVLQRGLQHKPYSAQQQILTSRQSFCLKPTTCLDTRDASSESPVSLRILTTKATGAAH